MAEWEYFTNQKQWESYLKRLLRNNNEALKRAILCIYNNQTDEEKHTGMTIEENNVGFSSFDAYDLSCIAEKIKKGKPLTKDELNLAKYKMQKYWRQLMVIGKRKAKQKELEEEQIKKRNRKKEYELQMQEKQEKDVYLQQHFETLRLCLEEGKSCDYGICDECPLTINCQV